MIRAVIDANVLVSGLLAPKGNEALILLAVHQGLVRPCFSGAIMQAYEGVLARPKFSFAPEQIAILLAMLRANGELFEPRDSETSLPDPDDIKFLHCAEEAGAEFIVTGNKRDFLDAPYGLIHVVNASELLDRITAAL